MNDVQQTIQMLRKEGWTLAAISQALNLPESTLRKWSAGARYPANAPFVRVGLEMLGKRKPAKSRRPAAKPDEVPLTLPDDPYPVLEVRSIEEFYEKYDPEKARVALEKSAGGWAGLDTERMKKEIYEDREQEGRDW